MSTMQNNYFLSQDEQNLIYAGQCKKTLHSKEEYTTSHPYQSCLQSGHQHREKQR